MPSSSSLSWCSMRWHHHRLDRPDRTDETKRHTRTHTHTHTHTTRSFYDDVFILWFHFFFTILPRIQSFYPKYDCMLCTTTSTMYVQCVASFTVNNNATRTKITYYSGLKLLCKLQYCSQRVVVVVVAVRRSRSSEKFMSTSGTDS
jgi:hypothetical protein